MDLCEILSQVLPSVHGMVSGAQTSRVSYTGPLLLHFISMVICCSFHMAPSVLHRDLELGFSELCLDTDSLGEAATVGTCHPWEEPGAERSPAKSPLCQGPLCPCTPREARDGCVFLTDNQVCSYTSLSSYVLAQKTAEMSITYLEVTPCRWKHLAL